MKKFFILLFSFALIAGFAMAQDDDLGLTAGLEVGIFEVNKPNDAEDMYPYVMPMIIYENSFLDGALDLFAEIDYTLIFTKEKDKDGNDSLPMDLYFDLEVGYNLDLNPASTLSFILENENVILITPNWFNEGKDRILGILRPGVKYNQNMANIGDLYAKAGLPIGYAFYGDKDTWAGLEISAGWNSEFGLGLEATGHFLFTPKNYSFYSGGDLDEDIADLIAVETPTINGFNGFSLKATFDTGPVHAEVKMNFPVKDLKKGGSYSYFKTYGGEGGIQIIPMFEYTVFSGLNVYAKCKFGGIGIDDNDLYVSPALGVTYSF